MEESCNKRHESIVLCPLSSYQHVFSIYFFSHLCCRENFLAVVVLVGGIIFFFPGTEMIINGGRVGVPRDKKIVLCAADKIVFCLVLSGRETNGKSSCLYLGLNALEVAILTA